MRKKYFSDEERKSAARELARIWRANNVDKVCRSKRNFYLRHKEDILKKTGLWQANNRDKTRAMGRKYYHSHKEKYRKTQEEYKQNGKRKEIQDRYYSNNKEEILRKKRHYYRTHPEKVAVYKARRKARMNLAEGDFTESEWLLLLYRWNKRCLACGATENITVDHIVPLAVGGTNYISNLQPLCKSCNSSKKDKTIDYRLDWT